MPTLILSPRYTEDSNVLWKAAIEATWNVERLHTHRPPAWLRDTDAVFYGEALFVTAVAEMLDLVLFEPPLRWLADLPISYTGREIRQMTLAEARSVALPAFIKPAGDKSFDARVYAASVDLPAADSLPDRLPVLVSEPVEWEVELRCFVKQRHLLTLCVYKGEMDQAEAEGKAFCETLLHNTAVSLPPSLVIDVGYIRGRGWAVVEANPVWASGVYACDPLRVLEALVGTCVKQEALTEQDQQWVVERGE